MGGIVVAVGGRGRCWRVGFDGVRVVEVEGERRLLRVHALQGLFGGRNLTPLAEESVVRRCHQKMPVGSSSVAPVVVAVRSLESGLSSGSSS